MEYKEYVKLVNNLDDATTEELNLFMKVESIADQIFVSINDEDLTIEEAEIKAKEIYNATDNEMDLAIAGFKDRSAEFNHCLKYGHTFKSEFSSKSGYAGVCCTYCGMSASADTKVIY